ncbi:MAG TPA: CPBP family intramembrane glutamic endopeptidase [Dehalococcoidales bacterium]|nr:CPBP family intramembrane glutamic endopeptidase [Dehalococcoidales bacterium]
MDNSAPENLEQIPPAAAIPPRPGLWSGWATFGLSVAVLSISQLTQVLVFVISIILMFSEGFISRDPIWLVQNILGDGMTLPLAVLFSSLVGLAVTLLFIKMRRGFSVTEYLALKKLNLKYLLLIPGMLAATLALSILVDQWVEIPQDEDIFYLAYSNTPWPVLFWLAIVVVGPVFEEVLFRGFLFAGLKQTWLGAAGTIVITGVVFALLHSAQYGVSAIALICVLGILLGLVRWKSGSLWSSILLHGLWNMAQMIMMTITAE